MLKPAYITSIPQLYDPGEKNGREEFLGKAGKICQGLKAPRKTWYFRYFNSLMERRKVLSKELKG